MEIELKQANDYLEKYEAVRQQLASSCNAIRTGSADGIFDSRKDDLETAIAVIGELVRVGVAWGIPNVARLIEVQDKLKADEHHCGHGMMFAPPIEKIINRIKARAMAGNPQQTIVVRMEDSEEPEPPAGELYPREFCLISGMSDSSLSKKRKAGTFGPLTLERARQIWADRRRSGESAEKIQADLDLHEPPISRR